MLAKNLMGGGVSAGTARALGSTVNSTVTAAGSAQSTATALTADVNVVTTATAGQGVALYNGVIGDSQIVYNNTAVYIVVYPPSGGNFNQLAANAGFNLAPYTAVMCEKVTSTQWVGFLSA